MTMKCQGLQNQVCMNYEAEQRATRHLHQEKEKRRKEASEIYRLRQQVINERRKKAEWAGQQMAKETAAHKKKTAELQGKLAQALSLLQLNNKERELEDWKRECDEARAESKLERDANREATRVSMDTNNTLRIHAEDLQRKIHDAQVDADKKQELLIQTRMELDHMHHKIGNRRRERSEDCRNW